ncbi:MAG: flagellin FliC [Cyanobacteria bacterium]|nr:flagellin FliC [Cyanobacteriota bacterium]
MPSIINTNVSSVIAQYNLSLNQALQARSYERLTSGNKLNRAADDSVGVTIADKLGVQIRGYQRAIQNAQDGLSITDTAEGSLSVIVENLQRIRELSVQAANDTNGQPQRDSIGKEIRALSDEIERISQSSNFNGIQLLDGTTSNALLQIGLTSQTTDTLDISSAFTSARVDKGIVPAGIGLIDSTGGTTTFTSLNDFYNPGTGTSNITSATMAQNFINDVDGAISKVTQQLGAIGAIASRLQGAIDNTQRAVENYSTSKSRITDTDVAEETANITRSQILQQASISLLGQINNFQASALQLYSKQ